MLPENSLRRRLIAACVLLAVLIGGVFAAAAYIIIEAIEYELIEVRLTRAAEHLIQNEHSQVSIPLYTDLRIVAGPQIPGEWGKLKPGVHELASDGRVLQVLLVEQGGQRYAVIDDISDFEHVEFIGFVALWVAFFAGVLLALTVARASASRIIAPLTALAKAVREDDLAAQPQLLTATDEIGDLARAFDVRSSRMRDFLVRERLFTADVSHELRTPLTVILGAAEVLTVRLGEQSELRAIAERIRRTSADSAVHLSALLQLARSPDAIERQDVALRPLVEQELERWRPLLDGKPVALTFESPEEVWVRANPDLAAIAVGNLLRNACYFTERGSVRVALAREALIVEDTGPGVPSAVRGRLFEPFVRGEADFSTGSGLGLSIVQRVAAHLGWAIHLELVPHGGSRFTLTFAKAV